MSEEISRDEIAALLARGSMSEEMTREEAIKILKEPDRIGYNVIHANDEEITMYNVKSRMALDMAIKALEQINKIKAIIESPIYIQEDVFRYKAICEVFKSDGQA